MKLRTPMLNENEKKEAQLLAIKAELIAALKHNGFERVVNDTDETFVKNYRETVVITLEYNSIDVTISACIIDYFGVRTIIDDSISFKLPQEDEYDMYAEFGNPEKILERMMNSFYKKLYFLDALNDGKELCIYEKPSVQKFISTDLPF